MKKLLYVCIVLAAFSCREKYIAPVASTGVGILVVEGFITIGPGVTTIRLTSTSKLSDSANIYEKKAQVSIQAESGTTFPLTESANGTYTSASLNLAAGLKYRLRIITGAGKEYLSDYVNGKLTPAIDSISWQRQSAGTLQVIVHTHGSATDPKYYQWKTEETWEFHSSFVSKLVYNRNSSGVIIGVKLFDPNGNTDTSIFKCWKTENSSGVLLGNTELLSANSVHETLVTIPASSVKLGILYSINIKQYSLSKDAYSFLEKIRKNTEQLGSIFDAQPSDLGGNIHSVSNPAEIVVGYIDAAQEQQKRIFIDPIQVPGWNYDAHCAPEIDTTPSIQEWPGWEYNYRPTRQIGAVVSLAQKNCVDCTLTGTNKKPLFWP